MIDQITTGRAFQSPKLLALLPEARFQACLRNIGATLEQRADGTIPTFRDIQEMVNSIVKRQTDELGFLSQEYKIITIGENMEEIGRCLRLLRVLLGFKFFNTYISIEKELRKGVEDDFKMAKIARDAVNEMARKQENKLKD